MTSQLYSYQQYDGQKMLVIELPGVMLVVFTLGIGICIWLGSNIYFGLASMLAFAPMYVLLCKILRSLDILNYSRK